MNIWVGHHKHNRTDSALNNSVQLLCDWLCEQIDDIWMEWDSAQKSGTSNFA